MLITPLRNFNFSVLPFHPFLSVIKKSSVNIGITLQYKKGLRTSINKKSMVQILNVAEKNDAAKNLADILSRGGFNRREGFSKFNKIYEFETMIQGQRCKMVMTSVSGHLLNQSFTGSYKKWHYCNPLDLFDAPVVKICQEQMEPIKRTLEREARGARRLIIWTDCDREGENIGYEIISVCQAINPNLQVQRAKFSEITFQSVTRAFNNLGQPDERQNAAVDVRSELDLRIGAAFTRFQTLRLQRVFPQALGDMLISYGSCQFPTLGFVVERYKEIQNFVPEQFWKLKVLHEVENCSVDFRWKRVRLFHQLACQVLLERCQENSLATVKDVKSKTKSKWRPQPLDTIELEKLASRKLRINAKETMRIAEKLYTGGFISYPRTETNIFPKELDLHSLVQMQSQDPNWGYFAERVCANGPTPRQGRKSDQAHPPIHPTKYAGGLSGNEKIIYEFIVRHFLACCDKDAKGLETVVNIDIAGEEFVASGLIIHERNYLEVYPYDKWSDKEMPHYQIGAQFQPTSLDMVDGQTAPPPLLTEADLIALMEKHGIGTDATHADHIETIKNRLYVGLEDARFVPGQLGMGLVEGYDSMGFQMSKPNLRAQLEADLKRICEGTKDPEVVLREQISNYKNVFQQAMTQVEKIDQALSQFLDEVPESLPQGMAIPSLTLPSLTVMKCHSCGSDMNVRPKRDGKGFYVGCRGFPDCKVVMWFPETVRNVEALDEICSVCPGNLRKLKFTFAPHSYTPLLPNEYITCIGGCDAQFMETLDIRPLSQRSLDSRNANQTRNSRSDSGYLSSSNANNSSMSSNSFNDGCSLYNPANMARPSSSGSNVRSSQPSSNSNSSTIRRNGTHSGNFNSRSTGNSGFFTSGNSNADTSGNFTTVTNNNLHSSRRNGGSFGENNSPWNSQSRNQPKPKASIGVVHPIGNSSNRSTADGASADAIVCNCNEDAIILTVRKEGPNTGRQFYKCRLPQGQGCNFFLWADSEQEYRPRNEQGNWNGNSWNRNSNSLNEDNYSHSSFNAYGGSATDAGDVCCRCGTSAKRLTTVKEGPNKGRDFYICPKVREEQCGYFQWADEISGDSSTGHNFSQTPAPSQRGRGKGRGAASARKKKDNRAPSAANSGKRRCGTCGEEGHDRRNCPH